MGFIRLSVSALCGAALAFAAATEPAVAGPAEDYRVEIAEAQRLGILLFEQDRAISVAEDALPRSFKPKRNRPHEVLAERIGEDVYSVLFYHKDGERYSPLYVATVKQGNIEWDWLQFADSDSFGETQMTLIRARERALREPRSGCADEYRPLVIPDETIGHFVYVMAVSSDPNDVVIGGHLRHDVDPAGEAIVGFKKFTNACLTISRPDIPDGARVVGLAVSQVLTKHPTEIHVMASLKHSTNLYVITGRDEIWKVVKGNIVLTEE